jgi:hypothetical protein
MNKGMIVAITVVVVSVAGGLVYGMIKGGGNDVASIRSNMIKSSIEQCNRSNRSVSPQSVTDAQIEKFCSCSSGQIFASLSDKEIMQLADAERTGSTEMTDMIITRSVPIMKACRADAGLDG